MLSRTERQIYTCTALYVLSILCIVASLPLLIGGFVFVVRSEWHAAAQWLFWSIGVGAWGDFIYRGARRLRRHWDLFLDAHRT